MYKNNIHILYIYTYNGWYRINYDIRKNDNECDN